VIQITFNVSITGSDELTGEEKAALENVIVGESIKLLHSLKAQTGIQVSVANVTTNTTGLVNLLED
jgi:hypothetical protein